MRFLFALIATLVAFASPIMSQEFDLSAQIAGHPEFADTLAYINDNFDAPTDASGEKAAATIRPPICPETETAFGNIWCPPEQVALRTLNPGCGMCWCPLTTDFIRCPLPQLSGLNPASGCGTCCSNGLDNDNYCCPAPIDNCVGPRTIDFNGCHTCTCTAGVDKTTGDCCSTKQQLCAIGLVRGKNATTECTTCCPAVDANGVCCPHGARNGVCCSGFCPLDTLPQFIRFCENGHTKCTRCCTNTCPCCPPLSDPKCKTTTDKDGCTVCAPKCGDLRTDPVTGISQCCDLLKCAEWNDNCTAPNQYDQKTSCCGRGACCPAPIPKSCPKGKKFQRDDVTGCITCVSDCPPSGILSCINPTFVGSHGPFHTSPYGKNANGCLSCCSPDKNDDCCVNIPKSCPTGQVFGLDATTSCPTCCPHGSGTDNQCCPNVPLRCPQHYVSTKALNGCHICLPLPSPVPPQPEL
jgi:hypothetical protein